MCKDLTFSYMKRARRFAPVPRGENQNKGLSEAGLLSPTLPQKEHSARSFLATCTSESLLYDSLSVFCAHKLTAWFRDGTIGRVRPRLSSASGKVFKRCYTNVHLLLHSFNIYCQ